MRLAVSNLGLHCLCMSYKAGARLIWVIGKKMLVDVSEVLSRLMTFIRRARS